MAGIISCFIYENGRYIEVPLSEVSEKGKKKEKYKDRFFYPFGEYLLELTEDDWHFFYSFSEEEKELRKKIRRKKIAIFSIEALQLASSQADEGLDVIKDASVDVEEQAIISYFLSKLRVAISELTPEERQLIELIYVQGLSEQQAAEILKKSQSTINKRKLRILSKLLKMLLNN